MKRLDRRGSTPVLLALGTVTVLAAISATIHQFSLGHNRGVVERVNRLAAFYGAEMAAWHALARRRAGIAPTPPADAEGRYAVEFENRYDTGFPPGFTPSNYNPTLYDEGEPLNVGRTLAFDQDHSVLSRYADGHLRYSTSGARTCGHLEIPGSPRGYRLCLADPNPNPCEPPQLIDFETIPGDTPGEGLAVGNAFLASHGVTFGILLGGEPLLAKRGPPLAAFVCNASCGNVPDGVASGQEATIEEFFLTDDAVLASSGLPVRVSYVDPVAQASGILFDIDDGEGWRVEARNAVGLVIEARVLLAGDPGTGDGQGTYWAFSRPTPDITSLTFVSLGPPAALALDRFSPGSHCPR